MQTFLPYRDFARSARVLDPARLGKQRVETLQMLRALELPDYGWANHPAVRMWAGHTPALVCYGLACVREWLRRGHADSTAPQIAEFAPVLGRRTQRQLAGDGLLPPWLGDERLHASHRSALLRKDPAFYRPVLPASTPDDLPYFWPQVPAGVVAPGSDGRPVWVVRAVDAATLGAFLDEGVVGLDAACGVDVDATGFDAAGLREVLRERAPGRRPGKHLRQLTVFLDEVADGDAVAVPVEGGSALLLGTVTGGYRFAARSPMHRRDVRWGGRLPRSAVLPPAALQNPSGLFRVRVAEP